MNKQFGVAVKGIIKNDAGKIFLLYKSETEDVNPNSFDLPGGRVKRGEKLEDTIIREVKEETALDVQISHISRTRGFVKGDLHLVGITYVLHGAKSDKVQLSGEHTGFFWKEKEEIINGDYPSWLKEEIKQI